MKSAEPARCRGCGCEFRYSVPRRCPLCGAPMLRLIVDEPKPSRRLTEVKREGAS